MSDAGPNLAQHPAPGPPEPGSYRSLLSAVLWFGLIFGTLYILNLGKSFFIPLVIALIAVYLIHALSRGIQKLPTIGRFIPKPVAIILSFVIIFFLGYGLFSIVADNALSVANKAPEYQARLLQVQSEVFQKLGWEDPENFTEVFRTLNLREIFTTIATGLANLLGNLTLILIYSLFLIIELRFLPTKLKALFPDPRRQEMISEILQRIDKDVQTYIAVKSIVSLVTALLSYIIMRLVGLHFAEFWALLVFVLNFIPTIGSIVSTLLPSLLALVQFDSFGPILLVALGITAVQQLMGNILEPNIMGQSLNLSPLVVVISLILWSNLWGIVGMFLCVPITVILVIILSNFERTRWVAILLSQSGSLRLKVTLPGS